jgi:hypothetical protein
MHRIAYNFCPHLQVEFLYLNSYNMQGNMTREWRKNLSLRCAYCRRNLKVYAVRSKKDNKVVTNKGKLKQIGNKTTLSVQCKPCKARTLFETESPIDDKEGWRQIGPFKAKFKPKFEHAMKPKHPFPLPYEAFMASTPKKREPKHKPKQKFSKPKRGESLYLNCLYCGEDLEVYVLKNYDKFLLNRGKLTKIDHKSVRLTVACRVCGGTSKFERQSPYVGKYGWARVDANIEPAALHPEISEMSETSAMSYRRRRY